MFRQYVGKKEKATHASATSLLKTYERYEAQDYDDEHLECACNKAIGSEPLNKRG